MVYALQKSKTRVEHITRLEHHKNADVLILRKANILINKRNRDTNICTKLIAFSISHVIVKMETQLSQTNNPIFPGVSTIASMEADSQ